MNKRAFIAVICVFYMTILCCTRDMPARTATATGILTNQSGNVRFEGHIAALRQNTATVTDNNVSLAPSGDVDISLTPAPVASNHEPIIEEYEPLSVRYLIVTFKRANPIQAFLPGVGTPTSWGGKIYYGIYDRQRTLQQKGEKLLYSGIADYADLSATNAMVSYTISLPQDLPDGTYYLDAMLDTDGSGGQTRGDLASRSSYPFTIMETKVTPIVYNFTHVVPF